jgi:hypothetical protein
MSRFQTWAEEHEVEEENLVGKRKFLGDFVVGKVGEG